MPAHPLGSNLLALAPDNLPEHLRARLPASQAAAERNVAMASATCGARVRSLDEQAYAATRVPSSLSARITRLKFIAANGLKP